MRKSRYTDSQIMAIIKQNEQGVAVNELCREHGMSSAQFYKWRAKFGGMDASADDGTPHTITARPRTAG